jgi:hypothetical protein
MNEVQILRIRRNFLVFRPYDDPITIRPYQPADRGYYFLLHKNDIKIVRYTLEDNGFRDIKLFDNYKHNDGRWSLYWQTGPIKRSVYESLTRY